VREQERTGAGHLQVVVLDGNPGEDRLDEGVAARPASRVGPQRSDLAEPVGIGLVLAEQPLDYLTLRRGHGSDPGNRLSTPDDDVR
jgi:hypothetical protein